MHVIHLGITSTDSEIADDDELTEFISEILEQEIGNWGFIITPIPSKDYIKK